MELRLSICIPTYNRAELLRECLESVCGQAQSEPGVEVVVLDNASPDHTQDVIASFLERFTCVRSMRNERNLGYVGNQVKCFEQARGPYMALLCDDDLYQPGEVRAILDTVGRKEYAFVALNYFSFINDHRVVFGTDYAPLDDREFPRAYDIMNYPSVGHFSGFVFNTSLARRALEGILRRRTMEEMEKHRGIVTDVAVRSTAASLLPAYFIGRRGLAARAPATVDYDSLKHLCIDYYEYYDSVFREGVIMEADLAYRKMLVLHILPRAIVSNMPELTAETREHYHRILDSFFGDDIRYRRICRPLLYLARYRFVRVLYRIIRGLARTKKAILRKKRQ